jgi:hypothetical protein
MYNRLVISNKTDIHSQYRSVLRSTAIKSNKEINTNSNNNSNNNNNNNNNIKTLHYTQGNRSKTRQGTLV